MCSWKSPNSTESKTFSSPHNAGAPGCQVYKGWQCTVAVKCEFSARRCTDAQIFLSIHQEKGNYDVEAGDPPAFRYSGSRLILVEQSTQQPMHNMDPITKYNIVVDPKV